MRSILIYTIVFSLALQSTPVFASDVRSLIADLLANPANSVSNLEQIYSSNDPKIDAVIGTMFFDGVGVKINHPVALPFLERAAAANRPESQYRLGLAYSHSTDNYYDDPTYNLAIANEWFSKAAKSSQDDAFKNEAPALAVLGHLHDRGLGGIKQDKYAAKEAFRKAASKGDANAQAAYASLLFIGRDDQEALAWYERSASVGSAQGFGGLGDVYWAARKNDLARKFLRQAAIMGFEPASRSLYIRFNEKIGNNSVLEQEKDSSERKTKRDFATLKENLVKNPMLIGFLASALIVAYGIYANKDRPPNTPEEQDEIDRARIIADQKKWRDDFETSLYRSTCVPFCR